MTITWSLPLVVGDKEINNDEKCRQIACRFNDHANATVQRGVHRPMEHIQGFTQSHWMLPSGKCLRRIAPTAAMVDEFE